jgi:hypothetical protein
VTDTPTPPSDRPLDPIAIADLLADVNKRLASVIVAFSEIESVLRRRAEWLREVSAIDENRKG